MRRQHISSLMSLPCLIIKKYNEQYENSARDDSCYILKQEIRKTQTLDIPFSYFYSEVHTNIGNCICLEFSIWTYIKLFYFLLLRSTKEIMFPTHILSSLLSATNLWSLEVLSEEIVFSRDTANGPDSEPHILHRKICMCSCCYAWEKNLTLYKDHSDW